MASQIEPDPTSKAARRPADAQAKPPVAPKATAKVPPPKPAAKPTDKAAAVPPPQAAPAAAQADADHDEEPEVKPATAGFLSQTPAWAISLLVHVVLLLSMALMGGGEPTQIEKPTVITSSTSEAEEEFSEFEEQ